MLEEGEELGCLAFQLIHSPITHASQRNMGSLGESERNCCPNSHVNMETFEAMVRAWLPIKHRVIFDP